MNSPMFISLLFVWDMNKTITFYYYIWYINLLLGIKYFQSSKILNMSYRYGTEFVKINMYVWLNLVL